MTVDSTGRARPLEIERMGFAVAICALAGACTPPPQPAQPAPQAPALAAPSVVATAPAAAPSRPLDPALPAEPRIAPPCSTLRADKVSRDGMLADADELRSDAARIQAAIDACPSGQSVKLGTAGAANAFLSGPLTLRAGVALWVDSGVTLFASRNPRDFDVVPGKPSCGTNANNDIAGCRSLINVNGVAGASLVGAGTLDGRGGEPMLGGNITWWDVAQDAKVKDIKHSNPRIVDVRKAKDFTMYGVTVQDSP